MARSSLYLAIQEGRFPSGIKIGLRGRRWRLADILAWQDNLAAI